VIEKALTGAIGGVVTNHTNAPVAYAIADTDTVTSSPVNPDTGEFTLAFLPGGTYAVVVSDTTGVAYTSPSVTVTAGQKTLLGDITLQ
jgi:DNA gyrase inhibitor GyrI